jgi:hypothetical protein
LFFIKHFIGPVPGGEILTALFAAILMAMAESAKEKFGQDNNAEGLPVCNFFPNSFPFAFLCPSAFNDGNFCLLLQKQLRLR